MKKVFYSVANVVLGTVLGIVYNIHNIESKHSTIGGRAVIVRRRKKKHRDLKLSEGEVFKTLHCGLYSVSVEHKKGRQVFFHAINDDRGVETVV